MLGGEDLRPTDDVPNITMMAWQKGTSVMPVYSTCRTTRRKMVGIASGIVENDVEIRPEEDKKLHFLRSPEDMRVRNLRPHGDAILIKEGGEKAGKQQRVYLPRRYRPRYLLKFFVVLFYYSNVLNSRSNRMRSFGRPCGEFRRKLGRKTSALRRGEANRPNGG